MYSLFFLDMTMCRHKLGLNMLCGVNGFVFIFILHLFELSNVNLVDCHIGRRQIGDNLYSYK
jgi:hypothetical protein